MYPLFASILGVFAVIIPLLGIVVFLIINNAKTTFTLNLNTSAFASGENVEGSVSISSGKELPAEGLTVTLVGIYEETRRKARSTVGYDEDEDEWESSALEVFRHEESLEIALPVPKKFKGDIPFSFPAPLGQQVSVRTPAGGIRQGAEIPVGELPGAGFANLNWTITASLDGSSLEPQAQMIEVTLG